MTKRLLLSLIVTLLHCAIMAQIENCTNGIDDDLDGLIDLNDPDCECIPLTSSVIESYIPNPSFEDTTCCPTGNGQLDCAESWIQASNLTTDYFHQCDNWSTVVPQPLPGNGQACAGILLLDGYFEYVGACLLNPFTAGNSYQLKMNVASAEILTFTKAYFGPNVYGPVELTVYGTPDCTQLPWTGGDCPTAVLGDWEVLGSITYDPLWQWQEITIDLISTVDIEAVAIGPPCTAPAGYPNYPPWPNTSPYFLFDNLILNEASAFTSDPITETYTIDHSGTILELTPSDLAATGVAYGQYCFDTMALNSHPSSLGTYQWYYDGIAIAGENDSILNVPFDDYLSGEYTFSLIVNADTCAVSTVTTFDPIYPVASMMIEPVCFPESGEIASIPDAFTNAISWDWTVNGTVTSNLDTFDYNYTTGDEITVQLVVSAENYCQDTITNLYTPSSNPVVDFSLNDACENATVTLQDLSTISPTNTIDAWTWSMSGAQLASSALDNLVNTYPSYGTYDIQLTVETSNGCVDSLTLPVTIHPQPIADFELEAVCVDLPTVDFQSDATVAAGSIVSSFWTFGNDSISNLANPTSTYSATGRYDVELVVTTDQGCQDSLTIEQIVSDVHSMFSYSDVSGCGPLSVEFNSESISSEGVVNQFVWDFNNGDNAVNAMETSVFINSGFVDVQYYDVSLTVTDNHGCIDSVAINQLVAVFPQPEASFDIETTSINSLNSEVIFTNTSVGADNYIWDFDDGEFAETTDAAHNFSENNSYWVTLLATTDYNCQDSAGHYVDVPEHSFIYVPNTFTPNKDGLNEYFGPIISGPAVDYSFEIFDRNGIAVFSSNQLGERWNGSYRNEENFYVADGMYAYRLSVRFTNETEIILNKGTVTIVR